MRVLWSRGREFYDVYKKCSLYAKILHIRSSCYYDLERILFREFDQIQTGDMCLLLSF